MLILSIVGPWISTFVGHDVQSCPTIHPLYRAPYQTRAGLFTYLPCSYLSCSSRNRTTFFLPDKRFLSKGRI